jgi:hypothetical protein
MIIAVLLASTGFVDLLSPLGNAIQITYKGCPIYPGPSGLADILSVLPRPLAWANELPRRWRSSMDIRASSLPFEAQGANNSLAQANGQCCY